MDRRLPPPTSPAPAPADRADSAKRDTETSPPGEPVRPGEPKAGGHARKPGQPAPADYVENGYASWYGVPYHGRQAANGEIYDMYRPTAAHRTLPFETMVRVTNLTNGRSTDVRITDRGPFVENRVIDLSLAAAREIDMVAAGVARVQLEVISGPDPRTGSFTVQVGAFLDRGNAERLRDLLAPSYSPVSIQEYDSPAGLFYRVRVGRFASESAARQLGEQLRNKEGFVPFVVRLDETDPAGGNR